MHRSSRRLWLHASASSLLGLALAPASTRALAQPAASALPKGTLTLVVPFAAGGATDVVSRLVAQKLG
ncbi:MAG: tripartite tricarboxylate transporter substrate binding protein, partial [Comamonas sp.]